MSLFRSQKDTLSLILDIQSSVVRSALVYFPETGLPTTVFVQGIPMIHKNTSGSAYLIKTTLKAVDDCIDAVLKELSSIKHRNDPAFAMLPDKISSVHYVLSSPWIVSQAKTVSMKFAKPTKITDERIEALITEERSKLIPDSSSDLVAIEEKVFDVTLNGYSVNSWHGKVGEEIGVSVVVSIAGTKVIDKFRESCRRVVSGSRVHFHSSLLLQSIGIQKVMPSSASYMLIHIHGELTDVVVVNHHTCTFFGSYPTGINCIIRKLAKVTKTDEKTAESTMTLYVGNQLEKNYSEQLSKDIEKIAKEWTNDFANLFKQAGYTEDLPSETLISARTHDDFFAHCFKMAHPDLHVKLLSDEQIMTHMKFFGQSENLRVLGLCIIAIHSLLEEW